MKPLTKLFTVAATAAALALSACTDETSTLGGSLVNDKVEIVIDTLFTITGEPTPSTSLPSRTMLQLLGRLETPQYGAIRSDFVTQLMPAEHLDTAGVTAQDIDSVKLIMRMPFNAFVGDTLSPMGITVYPLTKSLPVPIYSDFNPEGYYDPTQTLASKMFAMHATDSLIASKQSAYRFIEMSLGRAFGQRLLEQYRQDPQSFATPQAFAQWFPGMYVKTTFGSGRVVQIDSTVVTVYYHQTLPIEDTGRDTTYIRSRSYLAVTPEVLTNNNIGYQMAPSLRQMADDGEPILVAPIGYDVNVTLPAKEIAESFHNRVQKLGVVNALTVNIPVEEITNPYGITPPPYVLLVKRSEKERFFRSSMLPDNRTSFYASYDSYNHCYVFTGMDQYASDLVAKETIEPEDGEFVICPVTVAFETTSNAGSYYYYYNTPTTTTIVSSVTPYVNRPAMGKLLLEKAKISFTYSVQYLNN